MSVPLATSQQPPAACACYGEHSASGSAPRLNVRPICWRRRFRRTGPRRRRPRRCCRRRPWARQGARPPRGASTPALSPFSALREASSAAAVAALCFHQRLISSRSPFLLPLAPRSPSRRRSLTLSSTRTRASRPCRSKRSCRRARGEREQQQEKQQHSETTRRETGTEKHDEIGHLVIDIIAHRGSSFIADRRD